MTEAPVGGRVLVVVPTGAGDDPQPTDRGGSFVRGGDVPATDSGGRAGDPDDLETADSGGRVDDPDDPETTDSDGSNRVCSPQEVATNLSDRLAVEVVCKGERTAAEYLDELGPTLDCVVVVGSETGPLGSTTDGSVPAIVCEAPIVDVGADVPADAVALNEVTAEVRAVVREGLARSELRDRNARLTALNRYAKDITGCETVDAVLHRAVKAATDALAFDYCVILLVDGDRFVSRASALPNPGLDPIDLTDGIAGRTLSAGEGEIVADLQSDPDAVVEHDDLHGVLSVPIGSEGVLQIASRERDAFDERDREFAEILSGYTREALARLEREAGLRAERDGLYELYTALPLPALHIERRDGEVVVASANAIYESAFGEVPAGETLANATPTDTERESYETALCADDPMQVSITRSNAGGSEQEYTLTLVPTSPPGVTDSTYGVYRAD